MTNNPSVSLISGPSVNIVEGSYTFTVYNGTYGVNLTVPNGYDLSVCPPLPLPLPPVDNSNPRTVQVNSVNISGIDFYLTPEGTNSWWQTRGGDVGANSDNNIGTAVSSNLPPNTLLSLASTISLPFPFDMDQGVLLYQMTSVNPLNFGSGFWVDTMNPDKWIAQSAYELGDNNLKREDFSLFRELFNLPDPTDDGTGSSAWDAPNNDNSKFDLPETHPGDTDTSAIATIPNTFVYQGDLTLADWGDPDVAVDGTYIVLVNGDLTLAADFTVQEGGFAMFIVSGDITINPAVTKAEGIYVADGVLELETAGASSDALLNGAGTFVGWGGVEFWRNIGDPNNPSSVMTYRPDFLLNAPNDLRLPVFSWSQVNPLKVDTGAYAPWPPTPTP